MAIRGSARSIRAGRAAIDLTINDKTGRQLRKVTSNFEKWGKSMRAIGIGIGAAAAGLGVMVWQAKNALWIASDLQESMNAFRVSFKDSSEEMEEWGLRFGREVGRSRKEVMDTITTFGLFTRSLDLTTDEMDVMARNLTRLTTDLGSLYNLADAEVMERLQSYLVGNHETMRRLNVIITETMIKQRALNKGWGENIDNLTDTQKALIRYEYLMERAVDAKGDAIRTADEFANAYRRAQASITDLYIAIGEKLIPAAEAGLKRFNDLMRKSAAEIRVYVALIEYEFLSMGESIVKSLRGMSEIYDEVFRSFRYSFESFYMMIKSFELKSTAMLYSALDSIWKQVGEFFNWADRMVDEVGEALPGFGGAEGWERPKYDAFEKAAEKAREALAKLARDRDKLLESYDEESEMTKSLRAFHEDAGEAARQALQEATAAVDEMLIQQKEGVKDLASEYEEGLLPALDAVKDKVEEIEAFRREFRANEAVLLSRPGAMERIYEAQFGMRDTTVAEESKKHTKLLSSIDGKLDLVAVT